MKEYLYPHRRELSLTLFYYTFPLLHHWLGVVDVVEIKTIYILYTLFIKQNWLDVEFCTGIYSYTTTKIILTVAALAVASIATLFVVRHDLTGRPALALAFLTVLFFDSRGDDFAMMMMMMME